ncbi:hypothetical protein KY284_013019 [Solanum tuberosum]|nr:hypothetical protein KY284_013019 [Solanum tuberosum]
MVVSQMVQNGYEPGKGLRLSLQGIVDPINPMGNQKTFGLGFNPTRFDRKWANDRKRNIWNLLKPIPHIAQYFIKSRGEQSPDFPLQNDVDELCQGIKEMFYEVNMTQMGEGTSHMDVQFVGPNVRLNNWEATPLPTRKKSCYVNVNFNNMTCMRSLKLDRKKLSDLKTMNPKSEEYDEDEAYE